jgi:chemotaxis protein MotB
MMAFFMLMWLLNATTEVQRKGIADYFNPTIPINRISGGGDGLFGGDNIFNNDTLSKNGTGGTPVRPVPGQNALGDFGDSDFESDSEASGSGAAEDENLEAVKDMLTARSGESMVSNQLARHIITRVTDEGLIVEIFDLADLPLFEDGTNRPTQTLNDLVATIAPIYALMANKVAVNGFTSSQPLVVADNQVWNLSSARADAVRRLLETRGLPADRVQRITGYADQKPWTRNPMSPRNNRIEMILLRNLD